MKAIIVLFFISINFFACDLGSLNHSAKSKSEIVATSPTPYTNACTEENYRHKSEAEIAAMTPRQLIDEELKKELHIDSFDSYSALADYGWLINQFIRKAGIKVLPILTEHMNAYEPKSASRCEENRFFVAFKTAHDIDGVVIRLRGTNEGLATIEALDGALRRMKDTGSDKPEHAQHKEYKAYMEHQERLRGGNLTDGIIRDTLRVKHNIQMSDEELLEFSNFLTGLDPTYPSWSEMGEYSAPMVLKDSKRYYEAYLKFKEKK